MPSAQKNIFIIILSSLLLTIFFCFWFFLRSRHILPPLSLPKDLSGNIHYDDKQAFYEGKQIPIPSYVFESEISKSLPIQNKVLSAAIRSDRYIEVDLSEQKLRAWEGDKLFLETPVSTGLPWFPTPTGEFTIWLKLRATRMEGGEGKYYYNLPNVPYVMFFQNDAVPSWRGYSLHGTYWHNDFGHQHSHGCVNLPTPVAKELYFWTYPMVPDGKNLVYATDDNPGTKIVIHE
jgi:lipoprotein-anchoring transpeptidase ErfK/SrfK